jgi:uncharacterized membrane protein
VGDRWDTGRLEAFSDGVIAIAITLLVIEISVPESSFDDLWKGIADQWPSYLAYTTSFVTIGGLWLAHHGIFRRLASADGGVMRLNILLLMFIAFLPFPTKLVAEAVDTGHSERAAVIFYGLVLFGTSLVITALWRYIAGHRDLLAPDVSDREITALTQQTAPSIGFYAAVVLLAVFAPRIAAFAYLGVAVIAVFRSRGDYTATRTADS